MRQAHELAVTAVSGAVLLLALHGAAFASGGPPPMLNPYVRTSPSAGYSLLIFNTDGTVVGKSALPAQAAAPDWAGPFVAAGGREIWLVELGALKVFRFAAPQEK